MNTANPNIRTAEAKTNELVTVATSPFSTKGKAEASKETFRISGQDQDETRSQPEMLVLVLVVPRQSWAEISFLD